MSSEQRGTADSTKLKQENNEVRISNQEEPDFGQATRKDGEMSFVETDQILRSSGADEHDTATNITSIENQDEDIEDNIELPEKLPSGDAIEDDIPKEELTIDLLESKEVDKETKKQRREQRQWFQQKVELENESRAKSISSQTKLLEKDLLETAVAENLSKTLSFRTTDDMDVTQQSSDHLFSMRDVFLDEFDDLPSFSDLSSEEEVGKKLAEPIEITVDQPITQAEFVGKFVDPLSGIEKSTSSTASQKIESTIFSESEKQSDDDLTAEDESSGLGELDLIDELQSKYELKPVISETENILEEFIRISEISDDETRVFEINLESSRNEVQTMVSEFLNDLITKVLDYVEKFDPNERLAQDLDKFKLLTELKDIIFQHTFLKNDNLFLNRKVMDYFKSMKARRFYEPLSQKVDIMHYARYRNALNRFDHLKNLLKETNYKNACLMSSVLMDLQHIQSFALSAEEHLEETMKNILVRKNSDYMRRSLDRELRQMKYLQNELGDTRLFLITRKHTLAMLSYKMEKIEEITPELSMSQFITVQTDVQTIHKKLEERSSDLEKACQFYNQLIHQQTQSLEKSRSISCSLIAAKQNFKEKLKVKRQLRDRLYKLKMEHIHIQHEKRELTMQGGLLTNILLMFDYDNAVEKVALKKQRVAELKFTYKELEKKIIDGEKKLTILINAQL